MSKAASQRRATGQRHQHFDVQTVQEALVHLGEDFYTRILGEQYKRSGNHLRFGRKGSLNVTLSGTHAGHWHSFETDEGGGPIQLLMNPTYGWGLTFPEALKEGARLAGLSSIASLVEISPPKEMLIRPAKKADDYTQKIARARYYYQSAVPIQGTLGERYLREHRHIMGDLSAFRFHPNIRDDVTDQKGHHRVSYHPGIVVGAHNSEGEITAVHTILLDPHTANQVSDQSVGAVKRTRGDLKGSAVRIHSGNSHQVIIAEGPETAASLIQAAPDANIYVTLGNIKNAAALGWLAKQHHTDTFYFAADNDGPEANNVQLLKSVAQSLRDEHQIRSRIAMPVLPQHKKCDFNDVLREQGLDAVKRQLSHTQPIIVPARELREAIPAKAIDQRLHGSVDEWERLKIIRSPEIDRVVLAKSRLDQATEPRRAEIQMRGYKQAVKTLCRQEKVFSKVKAVAPQLAESFEALIQPSKPVSIDWLSDALNPEFDRLTSSKDQTIQYLVRFRDLLKQAKAVHQAKRYKKRLESLALDIVNRKSKQKALKQLAPKLGTKLMEFAHSRSKQRDIGRDF